MAYYYVNDNKTLNTVLTEISDSGAVFNPDADVIQVQNNSTLTIDESPTDVIGFLRVTVGTLIFDGANALKPIHYIGTYKKYLSPYGLGKVTSTLGWYQLGTSDGTANQVFDTTDYWTGGSSGSDIMDIVTGCWVETGRRISYTSSVGYTPAVDDYLSSVSDKDNFGRILTVSDNGDGTGYIVVKWINKPILDGEAIEVIKLVDNSGSNYESSWVAIANGSDVLEPDVFSEFGNTMANNINYNYRLGIGVWGMGFFNDHLSKDLIFGDGVNGYIPPNGARIRLPMVTIGCANTTDYNNGVTTKVTASYSYRYYFKGTYTGAFNMNGVMFTTALGWCSEASQYSATYCVSPIEFGNNRCPNKVSYHNCIVTDDPFSKLRVNRNCFGIKYNVVGSEVYDSLTVQLGVYISGGAMGSLNSSNTDIHNCISLVSEYNSPLSITTSTSFSITNCILSGAKALITSSSLISLKDIKYSCITTGGLGSEEYYGFYFYNYVKGIDILGLTVHNGSVVGDSFILLADVYGVKIRCIGNIHDKIDRGSDCELAIKMSTPSDDLILSRMWFYAGELTKFFSSVSTSKNFIIQNCSGDYASLIYIVGVNPTIRGLHGGSGRIGDTSTGLYLYVKSRGVNFIDYFRSDTSGLVVMTPSNTTEKTEQYVEKSRTDIMCSNLGTVDLLIDDWYVIEQDYVMLGHTSFTGVVTFSKGTGAINDGYDEYGSSNVAVEFKYDTGNGYNVDWLDARVSSNLTNITNMVDGVRLKVRLTALANSTLLGVIGFHTTTTLDDQNNNLYPIDQIAASLVLIDIATGSEVRIYTEDLSIEIFGTESTLGDVVFKYNRLYTNLVLVVYHKQYITERFENFSLTGANKILSIKQRIDRVYNNPA